MIAAWHMTGNEKYRWLNDAICVGAGEVRWPDKPVEEVTQIEVQLLIDISEVIWEAPQA